MTTTCCDQCGVTAPIAIHHEDHGALCSLCAFRQTEHDGRRTYLSGAMYGFTADDGPWED